ncbi:MAG: GNAT family N-acetyltransferase [Cyanobium sp.]
MSHAGPIVAHPNHTVSLHKCGPADYLPLADWCDAHLGGDYFFRRRHLESIIKRPDNCVYAVLIDGDFGGFVIMYRGSILHNLHLAPIHRTAGIGSAVLEALNPSRIRCKTNMQAGDPTGFYERNGYAPQTPDPARPHIVDMVKLSPGAANSAAPTAPPPPPVASPALPALPPGVTYEDLAKLERMKKNAKRTAEYRERKKAEMAALPTAAPETQYDPLQHAD